MRLMWIMILLLLANCSFAQVIANQINFGQMKYDLTEQRLVQQDLETILNTFSTFGDKEIALEEVIKSFLIKPNTRYADSLINIWLTDYTREDSIRLFSLPAIKDDFRERAFNMVWMSYFVKAYIDDVALIEAMMAIHEDKLAYFPHLPDMGEYSEAMAAVHNYYMFSKWNKEFPNEYAYFENYLEDMTIQIIGEYSEKNLIELINRVVQDVKDRKLIYELYLPFPLAVYIQSKINKVEEVPPFAQNCNEESIETYLKDAYYLVFGETISDEGMLSLKEYIAENNLYDPQVIYLALILSKYE